MYVRFLRPKEWASERASEKEGRGDTSLCQWRLYHGESLWRKKFYETGLKNFLEFFNKKQYIYISRILLLSIFVYLGGKVKILWNCTKYLNNDILIPMFLYYLEFFTNYIIIIIISDILVARRRIYLILERNVDRFDGRIRKDRFKNHWPHGIMGCARPWPRSCGYGPDLTI